LTFDFAETSSELAELEADCNGKEAPPVMRVVCMVSAACRGIYFR
jgi:hypothetical protein